jgi:hypothetical protein
MPEISATSIYVVIPSYASDPLSMTPAQSVPVTEW